MAKSSKRPLALLALSKYRKIGDFILRSRTLVVNVGNNPTYFAVPDPTLLNITTDTDDLEAAEARAQTRQTGSAATRDLAYDVVLDDLRKLQNYVQDIADAATDEATAIAIINASGFDLRNHGVRVKPELSAKNGNTEGSVKLVAKSAGRASYEWQKSADGNSWNDLPSTLQAKTVVTGLTPGSRVFFHFRPILKDGARNWSVTVSIIVL